MNFQLKSVLFLLFSVAIFGSSCKKDEDATQTNHFIYDGTEYTLTTGYLGQYGEGLSSDCSNVSVVLHTSDITYSEDEEVFEGNGHMIWLAMNTASSTEIESGTYTFSDEPSSFTHCGGLFFFDLDNANDLGEVPIILTGTIDVEEKDNQPAITFDLQLDDGKTLTGYFNGALPDLEL